MPQPIDIVILAAGKGTRMKSDRPKVLHELAGRSLLMHVLTTARALEPEKICIVYGHGGDVIPRSISTPDVQMVLQEPQLGTGHALQQAIPWLNPEHVSLVLYGDVPLVRVETLQPLLYLAFSGKVALLTMAVEEPRGYGRIVRNNGKVLKIVEEKDASPEERGINEVNTGIMVVPNRHFVKWLNELENQNSQGEYYLTDIIGLAAAQGVEVATAQPQNSWEVLGVNSKSQLATLERVYQNAQANILLENGVTLFDPKRIDIRGEIRCGRDVQIDVNCIFEGKVTLGDNVHVGANCILRNVEVAEGTRIAPFSLLEETTTGAGCRIGPYARIRPGTRLADEVHIGNFVELKNSEVGFNSKINHLSYVGDTTVGAKVNIGAGTITCNYDGANKHRTIIEDEVFIGSDTQLIAPVTVCKGSTIGAGSTITKDTPAGELSLSRARQMTVSGWKRPAKRIEE